jgi:hypothetical protein
LEKEGHFCDRIFTGPLTEADLWPTSNEYVWLQMPTSHGYSTPAAANACCGRMLNTRDARTPNDNGCWVGCHSQERESYCVADGVKWHKEKTWPYVPPDAWELNKATNAQVIQRMIAICTDPEGLRPGTSSGNEYIQLELDYNNYFHHELQYGGLWSKTLVVEKDKPLEERSKLTDNFEDVWPLSASSSSSLPTP